jgi:hypothetical protein
MREGKKMSRKYLAVLAVIPATILIWFFFFHLVGTLIALYTHPETVSYDTRLALAFLFLTLGTGVVLGFLWLLGWGIKTLILSAPWRAR